MPESSATLFQPSEFADTAREAFASSSRFLSPPPSVSRGVESANRLSGAEMPLRIRQSVSLRLLMTFAPGLAIILAVALLPRAQATSQVWILPGAAETAGLFGARFSSTLFLSNLGNTGASVQIGFIPYSGKPTPAPATRSLAAGETQQISSVLPSLFGLSSDAGTLTVSSAAPLALWMTTVNIANTAGTYGLAIEPLSSEMILSAGTSGQCRLGQPNRCLSNQRSRGPAGSEFFRSRDGL